MRIKITAAVLTLGAILLTSCSSGVETPRTLSTKDLKVYEGSGVGTTIKGYFLDDIDVPYIDIQDLASYRMAEPFQAGFPIPDYSYSFSKGVLECKNSYGGKSYSLYIDGTKDEIRSNYYEAALDIFHYGAPLDLVGADRSPIAKPVDVPVIPEVEVTMSLSDYQIDLVVDTDTVLIPFALANAMFFSVGEKRFDFNGRAIFESSSVDNAGVNAEYYCYTVAEKNAPRSKASALFERNFNFFILNTFFGRKYEAPFSDFRDLARSLGIYADLSSTDPLTAGKALGLLVEGIDDIHSSFRAFSPSVGSVYGNDEKDSAVFQAYNEIKKLGYGSRISAFYVMYLNLNALRNTALGTDDWTGFHYYEDTCIIRFSGFNRASNDNVFLSDGKIGKQDYSDNTYNLLRAAFDDLKSHPEIKKIALDVSVNGGGDATTLVELAGFFMKTVHITIKNQVDGVVRTLSYEVDTNYDGVYDSSDYPGANYDVYCLVSAASFSCGNLFPFVLRDSGEATIVGTTSAGGSCIVYPYSSPEGNSFNFSGPYNLGTNYEDGSFVSVDAGIHPSVYAVQTDFNDDATLVAALG